MLCVLNKSGNGFFSLHFFPFLLFFPVHIKCNNLRTRSGAERWHDYDFLTVFGLRLITSDFLFFIFTTRFYDGIMAFFVFY